MRLRDVADLAGVSMTTASIVLRRQAGARISVQTRERVDRAAEELGYRPRQVDPAPRILGLAFRGELADVGLAFVAEVVETARLHEGVVVLLPGATEASAQVEVPHTGGVAMLGVVVVEGHGRRLAAPKHLSDRIVHVDLCPGPGADGSEDAAPVVVPDDLGCAMTVGRHLRSRGHRRLAIVADEREAGLVSRWRRGLLRVLGGSVRVDVVGNAAHLLDPDDDHDVGSSPADRPTAVLCMNGRVSRTVTSAIERAGLAVPRDIEVVARLGSGDDLPPDPRVVGLRVPTASIARAAVVRLVESAGANGSAGGGVTSVPFALPAELLEPRRVASNP